MESSEKTRLTFRSVVQLLQFAISAFLDALLHPICNEHYYSPAICSLMAALCGYTCSACYKALSDLIYIFGKVTIALLLKYCLSGLKYHSTFKHTFSYCSNNLFLYCLLPKYPLKCFCIDMAAFVCNLSSVSSLVSGNTDTAMS